MFRYDGQSGGETPGPFPNPEVKSARVSVCTVLRKRTGTQTRCQPLSFHPVSASCPDHPSTLPFRSILSGCLHRSAIEGLVRIQDPHSISAERSHPIEWEDHRRRMSLSRAARLLPRRGYIFDVMRDCRRASLSLRKAGDSNPERTIRSDIPESLRHISRDIHPILIFIESY